MEWLKALLTGLTEEQQTGIIEAFKTEFPKHAVPKEQYSKKTNELEAANEQLEKAQGEIEKLAKSEGTIEELKEQLAKSNTDYEAFKAETEKREATRIKQGALEKALTDAGAISSSVDLLIGTFNLDDVQIDKKGNIVDLEDVLGGVKEARKELFVTKKVNDNAPPKSKDDVDTSSMTDQEYLNYRLKKE